MAERKPSDTTRTYIELRNDVRVKLDNVLEDHGLPMVEFLSRVTEWVIHQDRKVVGEILSRTGDAAGELVRQRLTELSAAKGEAAGLIPPAGELTVADAARVIRLMTERIEQSDKLLREELKSRMQQSRKKPGG